MRRSPRGLAFVLGITAVPLVQTCGLRMRLPEIERDTYVQRATELHVSPAWHIGFIWGYHGAHLVRARNAPDFPPLLAEHVSAAQAAAARVHFAAQIEDLPAKALAEAIFYTALLAAALLGIPSLFVQMRPRWAAGGIRWALGWTLLILPLMALGYGLPLYQPPFGASGFTTSFGRLPMGGFDATVTYQTLIETLGVVPLSLACAGLEALGVDTAQAGVPLLWAAGALFSAVLGSVMALLAGIARAPSAAHRA